MVALLCADMADELKEKCQLVRYKHQGVWAYSALAGEIVANWPDGVDPDGRFEKVDEFGEDDDFGGAVIHIFDSFMQAHAFCGGVAVCQDDALVTVYGICGLGGFAIILDREDESGTVRYIEGCGA